MKLVTPPLQVVDEDGFQNDLFRRQGFGEVLANLIAESADEELVISLDGKWGEGKTTFVKMWQALLKEKKIPSIYIDAFKHDHTDDAFMAVASTINAYFNKHAPAKASLAKFKSKAKAVGVQLFLTSAKIGLKAATLGAINESDIDALKNVGADIVSDTTKAMEKFIEERLDLHQNQNELVSSFKTALSEMPASLEGNESGRLVIIIDELDRCKPDFSVDMLEKVKHLFSSKNIFFVLVVNKKQLEGSIRSIYGNDIDAHAYLQKFIHVDARMPKRVSYQIDSDFNIYCKRLLWLHELDQISWCKSVASNIEDLAAHFDFSLRQLEKVFANLVILNVCYGSRRDPVVYEVVAFLCVLKVQDPIAYQKISAGNLRKDELISLFDFQDLTPENVNNLQGRDRRLFVIMAFVEFVMVKEKEEMNFVDDHWYAHFRNRLTFFDREEIISSICKRIDMISVG